MPDIHINSTLAIATGIPATFDATGYEALTWVEIEGLVEAPAFGSTHADINIPNLITGRTRTAKGANSGVSTSLAYSTVADDAGQAAVLAAAQAGTGEYSLRLINADETQTRYCSGIIKDYQPNKPTTTSYEGASANFVPNYDEVIVDAA